MNLGGSFASACYEFALAGTNSCKAPRAPLSLLSSLARSPFSFSRGVPLFRPGRLKNLTVREQGDESNRGEHRDGGSAATYIATNTLF